MYEITYRLLEMAALLLCMHSLSGEKIKLDIYNISFVAVEMMFMQMIQDEIVSKEMYFAVYLIYFIYVYIKFKDSIKIAVLKCLIATVIMGSLQMIIYIPMYILSPIIQNESITVLMLNGIILVILCITKNNEAYGKLVTFCAGRDWLLRACFAVCVFVIAFCMYSLKTSNVIQIDIFILISLLMSMFMIFTYRWQKSAYELEKIEKELEMTNLYNDVFGDLIETIRRRQHDFHNQIDAIYSSHLTAKTLEELIEIQKEHCDVLLYENRFSKILNCINNSTVAGFIYTKFTKAEKYGIEIDYDVKYLGNTGISTYDLIEIMGILLDNAIEALAESDLNKKIIFNLSDCVKLDLCVKNPVSNISNDDLEKFFRNGYSTKGENRGMGLSKIKTYQNKYKYDIFVKIETDKGIDWLEICIKEK